MTSTIIACNLRRGLRQSRLKFSVKGFLLTLLVLFAILQSVWIAVFVSEFDPTGIMDRIFQNLPAIALGAVTVLFLITPLSLAVNFGEDKRSAGGYARSFASFFLMVSLIVLLTWRDTALAQRTTESVGFSRDSDVTAVMLLTSFSTYVVIPLVIFLSPSKALFRRLAQICAGVLILLALSEVSKLGLSTTPPPV